jgi:hypothetical protein
MRATSSRRRSLIFAGAIGILLFIAIGAAIFLNPWITQYVECDTFRKAMEKETAKGLHFPRGHYAPIQRSVLDSAKQKFQASGGEKAMKSIEVSGIAAKLDPWAVFVRSWQLDEVHVQSGEVEVQIYEHKPEPVSSSRDPRFFAQPRRPKAYRVGIDQCDLAIPG